MINAGGSMFRAGTTGDFRKLATKIKQCAADTFERRRRVMLISLNERILERTPVWEGDVIANWTWSYGSPSSEHVEPADNGPPGETGKMALGDEPRRGINEHFSRESLEEALSAAKGKYETIWLTNNSPHAVLVEIGEAPSPEATRAPAGALRVAVRELAAGFLQ